MAGRKRSLLIDSPKTCMQSTKTSFAGIYPVQIQYCAKVMQMIIDKYRDISAILNKILPSTIY